MKNSWVMLDGNDNTFIKRISVILIIKLRKNKVF